ncbi:leucyl/phenylalanyl-tRNA--protein transferase, partial [Cupriavidus plantarum]
SVETWYEGQRVGGLYGVALGRMFYGESMFAHRTDASKIALAALCAFLVGHGVTLIDCQQETDHLASLGASPIARADFLAHVRAAAAQPEIADWRFDKSVLNHWAWGNAA